MSVINTFGKPLLVLVLIILVLGVVVGLCVANYDPMGNAAQARGVDIANNYQEAMNTMNLDVQKAKAQAEIEQIKQQQILNIAKAQQDFQQQQALDQLEVARQQRLIEAEAILLELLSWFLGGAVLLLAGGATFGIVRLAMRFEIHQNQTGKTLPSSQPANWHTQRVEARQRELAERQRTLAQQRTRILQHSRPADDSSHNSRPYKDLPFAS